MTGDAVLGIVVVNYGSHRLLDEHLAHLDAAAVPARVVVVDNYTSDPELAAVRTRAVQRGWEVVTCATNVGFGEACNRGAQVALGLGCDVIMLLNPDAALTTEAVRELSGRSRSQPRAIVSPVICRPDGSVWSRGSRLELDTGRVGAVRGEFHSGLSTWLTGACLVVHHTMWAELGGFTGDYFLYWEDVDLSRRCVDLGGELVLLDNVTAVHDVGATQGAGKSPVYIYYNCRNRLLFGTRHLTSAALFRWILHTPAESLAIMRRDGFRAVLRAPRLLLAGLRGTAVGLGLAGFELLRRAASPDHRRRAVAAT